MFPQREQTTKDPAPFGNWLKSLSDQVDFDVDGGTYQALFTKAVEGSSGVISFDSCVGNNTDQDHSHSQCTLGSAFCCIHGSWENR